jgi:hypothetical protein
MKKLISILIIIFLSKTIYSQQQAFIDIYEEIAYPQNSFTKTAQKQYTWIINGTTINYKTGKYAIKVNPQNQFDTIQFRNISKIKNIIRRNRRTSYDTSTTMILCKFKVNHNYKLGQLFPGDFQIYSLDTLETKKTIVFKTINKPNNDTLFLEAWYQYPAIKVYSDTTITIFMANEKMEQSFLEHIEFRGNKPDMLLYDGIPIPQNNFFELSFNYLHAERLEIEYNFATKQYVIKLLD